MNFVCWKRWKQIKFLKGQNRERWLEHGAMGQAGGGEGEVELKLMCGIWISNFDCTNCYVKHNANFIKFFIALISLLIIWNILQFAAQLIDCGCGWASKHDWLVLQYIRRMSLSRTANEFIDCLCLITINAFNESSSLAKLKIKAKTCE